MVALLSKPFIFNVTAFLLYFVVCIGMLAVFVFVYTWITPRNEFEEIHKNKRIGPAITLGGSMLGFTIVLCSLTVHGAGLTEIALWATVAGIAQLAAFRVFYYVAERDTWNDMMDDKHMAGCVAAASISVCIGLINAFSLIP